MKAEIMVIGIVVDGIPMGWAFDGHGEGYGMEIGADGRVQLQGGYTIDELESIANA